MRLEGKVSLVTGSSRGIGRAIALAFAREGADVVLNCSRSVESANEVAGEIESLGRRALVVPADVADKSAIDAMIEKAAKISLSPDGCAGRPDAPRSWCAAHRSPAGA